jgi:hypothetical protein
MHRYLQNVSTNPLSQLQSTLTHYEAAATLSHSHSTATPCCLFNRPSLGKESKVVSGYTSQYFSSPSRFKRPTNTKHVSLFFFLFSSSLPFSSLSSYFILRIILLLLLLFFFLLLLLLLFLLISFFSIFSSSLFPSFTSLPCSPSFSFPTPILFVLLLLLFLLIPLLLFVFSFFSSFF